MEDCDDDEDVIFEGSALYNHLVSSGYETELETFPLNFALLLSCISCVTLCSCSGCEEM